MSGSSFRGVFVPAGQNPPFATITPNDHAAWIIISAAVGLSTTLVFAGIRVFIRKTVSPGYGYDDWLLVAATVFVVTQSIVVLAACADGLGKSAELLDKSKIHAMQQLYYASNILYVFPVTLSKAAVACFILRLTPVHTQTRFIWGLLIANTIWGTALLFSVALTCNPATPWLIVDQKEQCADYFLRWRILESIGCAYELAAYSSVVWLVWDLQTKLGNKTIVLVTFSFRLLLIVIAALRLGSANQADLTNDPTLRLAQFIAWTSAEMCYSVISATITILRPFVSNLATHYGVGTGGGANGYGYGYGNGSNLQSATEGSRTGGGSRLGLSSLTRSKNRDILELQDMEGKGGTKGQYSYGVATGKSRDSRGLHAAIPGQRDDARSVDSYDSQKMIIRKDVAWTVEEDV